MGMGMENANQITVIEVIIQRRRKEKYAHVRRK